MITPDEAEKLAHSTLEKYINSCNCGTAEDVGKVLLKLLSMTGLALNAMQGQANAVAAIESVALHVGKPKYAKAASLHRLN